MSDWFPGGAEWDECKLEPAHEQHGWAQRGKMREPIVIILAVVLLIVSLISLEAVDIVTHQYEYETTDGEAGIAEYCTTPYRGVPYCRLDDGTEVYGIKQYKKVSREEE